jgi:superfamily II DNA or RNA helicase
MEFESNVPVVQPPTWSQYIRFDGSPRLGQRRLWQAVASSDGPYLGILPPGYGKTLTACGAYAIAAKQGRVDRMLVLVPTDQQRDQWVKAAKKNLARCGHKLKLSGAYCISKEPRDLRYAADGQVEVFVATYQQAYTDPQFWDRLLSNGKWFIVFDECHHLSVDGKWGQETQNFTSAVRLYLTATPMRHDGKMLSGVPRRGGANGSIEIVPTVEVTYREAVDEQAVRPVMVHVHHYFVDVQMPDGRIERLTTERLRDAGVTDFSDYETKYQLRYCEKYLSSILIEAARELEARNLVSPKQHQMLVFAMTCRHAEAVSKALNGLIGPGFSDWIGVNGRSPSENDSVLADYEANKLQCLVQVDKAGEGFDNVRCSILVFLHLIKSATKNTQQIGRGLRRNHAIQVDDDHCRVFASADAPMLDVALDLEKAVELILKEQARQAGELDDDDQKVRVATIPPLAVVSAQLDRVDVVGVGTNAPHIDTQKAARAAEFLRSAGITGVELMPLQALVKVAEKLTDERASTPSTELFVSETSKIEFWRSKVKQAVGLLARNVVAIRAAADGERFERSLLGDTIRAIHAEWMRRSKVGHEAMTGEELQRKYEWVREINESLRQGAMPQWLRV